MRVKETFRRWGVRWETLTVAGRTIEKGFVISPQIAGILLVAFIGMAGWAYKSSTAESRETLKAITRMETMLDERTRNFDKEQARLEQKLETEKNVGQLQREKANNEIAMMKLAMQAKGIQINH